MIENRPPVVVVLGHVDHGKSSILEAIKDLKITSKESGGITQHIGAYEIEHQAKKITFIDTPGHEAFSAMRSRGADVADIAILVVAADEGIKPQTKEAIGIIKKSEIPMIVALNKIDKPEADPERIKRELIKEDVLVESMGGKIPSVEVSAKTKAGIDHLLELILLISELEGLKADLSLVPNGVVIESYLDGLRGPIATLILKQGILNKGDIIGTVSTVGKAKNLEDFQGKAVDKALPSMPVVVMGFESVPGVGEEVKVFNDTETAKSNIKKQEKSFVLEPVNTEKILNLVIKADVLGSLEAIEEVLKNIPQDQAGLRVLKAEVGDINDSDVKLAMSSDAKVIGFRVKANPMAKKLALREKVSIINFEIIYELAQAVRNLLGKMIGPEIIRTDLGQVKILAVFRSDRRQIIGGKVTEGKAKKGAFAEIYRNEEKIGKGKIVGLQQDKKETDEVPKRSECGMLFEGDTKIEEGDVLYIYTEEKRKIEL